MQKIKILLLKFLFSKSQRYLISIALQELHTKYCKSQFMKHKQGYLEIQVKIDLLKNMLQLINKTFLK